MLYPLQKMMGYKPKFVCETFFANRLVGVQISNKWKSMTITWSAEQRENRRIWRLDIADAIEGKILFYISIFY